MQRAVIEAPRESGLAFAREDERDDLVETRQLGGRHRVEEAAEALVLFGELQHFSMRATELAPDLRDAVGRRAGDLTRVLVDLLADDLGKLGLNFIARIRALHLGRDDRQHAVAELPDVLGDERDADAARDDADNAAQDGADDALADGHGHARKLAAHDQQHGAREALAALDENLSGGDGRARLGRIDGELAAGVAAHGARDHAAVARPEEGLHALRDRLGRGTEPLLHAPADLVADATGDAEDGLLHSIGAEDTFGRRRGELLRRLLEGNGADQLRPARLLAHFADGDIHLAPEHVVDVVPPPGIAHDRRVVEIGEALRERRLRDAGDGRAECRLVADLALLVLGARHRNRLGHGGGRRLSGRRRLGGLRRVLARLRAERCLRDKGQEQPGNDGGPLQVRKEGRSLTFLSPHSCAGRKSDRPSCAEGLVNSALQYSCNTVGEQWQSRHAAECSLEERQRPVFCFFASKKDLMAA